MEEKANTANISRVEKTITSTAVLRKATSKQFINSTISSAEETNQY
jgi:hypothetical protein